MINKSRRWILYRNVGTIDRSIRLLAGLVLLLAYLSLKIVWEHAWILALLGVLNLATGISTFCPLYVPFGISTVEKKDA